MNYFYVICPVGVDRSFAEKKSVLKEIGEAHGIEPFFPLEHHNRRVTIRATTEDIAAAVFVLADLSFERPSCYFELGVAEVAGAQVVLIAATGTTIHQVGDIQVCLFYSNLNEYRVQISQILDRQLALRRG